MRRSLTCCVAFACLLIACSDHDSTAITITSATVAPAPPTSEAEPQTSEPPLEGESPEVSVSTPNVGVPPMVEAESSGDDTLASEPSFVSNIEGVEPVDPWTVFQVDFTPREGSTYAAGGDWFFLWGGTPDRSGARPQDGFIFNVEREHAIRVADAPLDARRTPTSVWTGREFIVFGGASFDESFVDGARYDPIAQQWTPIADAPLDAGPFPASVWAGDKMYVWLAAGTANTQLPRAGSGQFARYDPRTDSWELLAAPPVRVDDVALHVIDGNTITLIGGPTMRDLGIVGGVRELHQVDYDIEAGTWSEAVRASVATDAARSFLLDGTLAIFLAGSEAGEVVRVLGSELAMTVGPPCWHDLAVATGATDTATYLKWCGSISRVQDGDARLILDSSWPGATTNTYGAGFVQDETGRLFTFGTPPADNDLAGVRAVLGVYSPSSGGGVDDANFCALTDQIEQIYDRANDQQLSEDDGGRIRELVRELSRHIPEDFSDDFDLRYWPVTQPSGDTSGIAAQAAFDRMGALYDDRCG